MMEFVNEKVLPRAMRLSQNKYLSSVSDGFMTLMPVLIIGSIFTLLNNLAIDSYQQLIVTIGLKDFLAIPNMVTNDVLSIYAVFFIAYTLGKRLDRDPGVAGMIALFTFLAVTPFGNVATSIQGFLTTNEIVLPAEMEIPGAAFIPLEWLGAKGLFVAIFVALLSTVLYDTLLTKNLMIKMPDSVPPTIAKSFAGLIPGFVSIILFMAVDKMVALIPVASVTGIQSGIYTLVQAPMESFLGNNIWSLVIAAFAAQLLWSFGIHGMAAIILPIFYPLWTSLNNANLDALNAGTSVYELPNIVTRSLWQVYVIGGGSGITLGLCLYLVLFAKSQQYKTLGKLSVVANVCGINEPIIFGLPMVLNPVMVVPFIMSPVLMGVLAYFLTAINVLPRLTTIVSLGTPVIMSGFISTASGSWRVAFFQVVIIVLTGLIYLPFIRILDKQAQTEELAA